MQKIHRSPAALDSRLQNKGWLAWPVGPPHNDWSPQMVAKSPKSSIIAINLVVWHGLDPLCCLVANPEFEVVLKVVEDVIHCGLPQGVEGLLATRRLHCNGPEHAVPVARHLLLFQCGKGRHRNIEEFQLPSKHRILNGNKLATVGCITIPLARKEMLFECWAFDELQSGKMVL